MAVLMWIVSLGLVWENFANPPTNSSLGDTCSARNCDYGRWPYALQSSGSCVQRMQGIDCTDNDISNQNAASFDVCCDLCSQNSLCSAFTYRFGTCWFKSACPTTTNCDDCVAGITSVQPPAPGPGPAPPAPPPGPPFTEISGVQSTSDLKNLLSPIPGLTAGLISATEEVIQIDTSTRFQAILGFGGAFTEAAAINFASLSGSDQEEVLNAYFAPPEQGGHGYTVGRVHMDSCDFSVASYSFDDHAGDTSLSRFDMNVTHDQKDMLPMMRRALAKAPQGIKIFASPWSPPAWMKTNGKMTGSDYPGLRPEDQGSWALYFSKFFTAYSNSGVKLWGLTVQNEPAFAAPWEACAYNAAEERDFVRNHLGPIMRRDHPNAKIMVLDHNRDMVPEWTSTIFGDAAAAQYVDGLAVHWYDSHSPQMYANVEAAHNQYPNKFILPTEACNCPGVKLRDWDRAWSIATDILGDLNVWAVGWTDWNLIVDHEGGPNHLGNKCDANIVADPQQLLHSGSVIKQVSYYLMGHFTRYLRPGMVRVKSYSPSGLSVTAFQDPVTKRTAVVVMNGGSSAVNFALQDKLTGTSATGRTIPSHSIQTYVYTTKPGPAPGPGPSPAPTPAPGPATCNAGDAVYCPGSTTVMCAGNQCCQDGVTCPSADSSFKSCPQGKTEDCTGQGQGQVIVV